jgi:predicted DNA-binding transcriptional regulator AlpA
MSKRWLRRRQVRQRYGEMSNMTLSRMVRDGRLPPPKFPYQNSVPAWDEAELDERDEAVVAGRAGKRARTQDGASDNPHEQEKTACQNQQRAGEAGPALKV